MKSQKKPKKYFAFIYLFIYFWGNFVCNNVRFYCFIILWYYSLQVYILKLPDTLSRSIQSAEKKDEPHIGNSSDGKMSYENTSNENESCYSGSEIDDEEYDETQVLW